MGSGASTNANPQTIAIPIKPSQPLHLVPLQKMQNRLHRFIGALLWTDRDHPHLIGRGTAMLISPDVILTCAHSIYEKKQGKINLAFRFYPAQYGLLGKGYKIKNYCFPEPYKLSSKHDSIHYDYALMILETAINHQDFIPLRGNFSDNQSTIAIYGYPAANYRQEGKEESMEAVEQWGITKQKCISGLDADRCEIAYDLTTLNGQSGAPIVVVDGQELSVVGVHKGLHRKRALSFGRLLNQHTIAMLQQQSHILGGHQFNIYEHQQQIKFYRTLLSHTPNADSYLQLAFLLQPDDLIEAADCYATAIAIDPLSHSALHLLGNLHYKQKQYKECARLNKLSLMVKPGDSVGYSNLAMAYKSLNMDDYLQLCYISALRTDPNNHLILNNCGRYLTEKRNIPQALSYLQQAVKIRPDFQQAWLNLGNAYYQAETYQLAVDAYLRAIHIDPNQHVVHYNLALTYEKLADQSKKHNLDDLRQRVLECLKRAAQINPGDAGYQSAISRVKDGRRIIQVKK